jgi:hypothetical protein
MPALQFALIRAILIVLHGLLGLAVPLSAQESVVVLPSARVRLTTDTGRIVGAWMGRGDDSVTILDARGKTVHTVAVRSVRVFEISRGKVRRTGRGALIGFLSGTTAGVVTALVLCRTDGCSSSGGEFGGFIAGVLGGVGAVAGTGIGALIGSQIRSERWEPAPLAGVRVGLIPTWSRALGVGLQVAWSPGSGRRR